MSIHELLAGLSLQMPGKVFSAADGITYFKATGDIEVILAGANDSDDFMLIADVAPFPRQSAEALAMAALKANWLFSGSAGVTFAICPETGFLQMNQLVSGANLTVDDFLKIVGRLAGLVARWRTIAFRLDRGEGVAEATSSDEILSMKENNVFA